MRKVGLFVLVMVAGLAGGCGDDSSSDPGKKDAATRDAAQPDAEVIVANCGDGFVDAPEQCDDGDEIADSICTATCRLVCGNGVVDTANGESCDIGIASGTGACPTSCNDGMACTTDVLASAGCQTACVHDPITARIAGDGCCPAGANSSNDSDCSASCGDGIVGTAETCDTAITAGAGKCPTACNDGMACTSDTLVGSNCTASCPFTPITAPANGDGCCPAGATNANDNDCLPTCGNGVIDSGELCDPLIPAGPMRCPTSCNDGRTCTTDTLVAGGTCQAMCTHTTITATTPGDGCCPAGAGTGTDSDCVTGCGDGVVLNGETCDTAIASGTGSCPTACNDSMACTRDVLSNGDTCTAACTFTPITTALSGDGCCPPGVNRSTDLDCPVGCGNGVVDPGEQCDTAISSGAGRCPTSCNDAMACTSDVLQGTSCLARCINTPITAPANNDGCCPPGATPANDNNCAAPPPSAFRMTDLDLRDPHVFVTAVGCRDLTDVTFGGFSVNDALQTNINTDASQPPDGLLDLSPTLVFRPLTQASGGMTQAELHFAACTATSNPSCRRSTLQEVMTMTTNGTTTADCLAPLANTLTPRVPGYSPAIVSTAASCFASTNTTVSLNLGGVPVALSDARIAATYSGNPATTLVNGLLMGFISESTANTTILPSNLPLVGGQPLSLLLPGGRPPGGEPNCASFSDIDTHNGVRGWWFYLNFPARRVTWSDF